MSHAPSLTERWDRTNSWVGTEELNSTNSCRSHQNYCRRTVDTLQIILYHIARLRTILSGGVAQLVEQRTHKPRVSRSIRDTATTPSHCSLGIPRDFQMILLLRQHKD